MAQSIEFNLLTEIRDEQKKARQERQDQSILITQIHTVLMGPKEYPDIGLLAQVGRTRDRVSRVEKFLMLGGGAGILGGGTLNWAALKSLIPFWGGH